MSEWLKILISAVVGMTTAVLLEPLKHWIGKHIAAREARTLIYRELARAYYMLDKERATLGLGAVLDIIGTETFDYYFRSKREVIHLIPNHIVVSGLLLRLSWIKHQYQVDPNATEDYVQGWIKTLEIAFVSGVIATKPFWREVTRAGKWEGDAANRATKLIKRVTKRMQRRKNKEMPSILQ